MIESYFDRPHTLARMRSFCTGAHIDAFADWLSALGYTRNRGRALLEGVALLGEWLDQRGVDLAVVEESLIEEFVADVTNGSARDGKPRYCRAGSQRFLEWARERSIVFTSRSTPELPQLIRDFNLWMQEQRGLSEATIRSYQAPLLRFVDALGEDPGRYDAASVRQFVLVESQRGGRGYAKHAVKVVRMLLRHLAVVGQSAAELSDAVPTMASWSLASLPRHLEPDEVERLIAVCDPHTLAGIRDRAMLLLMARLGLRSSDLVRMRLADLDWKNGALAVSGKSRRTVRMPLPQEVGDALLHWIASGRTGYLTDEDRVFLRLRAPIGPLTNVGVNNVVVRAAQRAGLARARVGPHTLRHSAATSLLRQGASLPAVSAMLRHEHIDTTTIYAKVDVDLLASIARPWPEERSP